MIKSTLDNSLDTYNGPWDKSAALHLLRRTLFGVSQKELSESLAGGLNFTIDRLFQPRSLQLLPQVYLNNDALPIGSVWVDQPYDQQSNNGRIRSFQSWWIQQMLQNSFSIHEKMILFWHNHFVIESAVVRDSRALFDYYKILNDNALGNFKELAKLITLAPAMLRYLDGQLNVNTSPNENYARELFELFTIGKGPQIAEGNYTNYTEQDVFSAARVLTGWRTNNATLAVTFQANLHDTDDKVFSSAFDKRVIQNGGALEYIELIDMIFAKEETAIHLARKLYRWFVYYHIDESVEENIIKPLANKIIQDDYEVLGAIELLLKSQHFYEQNLRGSMVKSPADFTLGLLRTSMDQLTENLAPQVRYAHYLYYLNVNTTLQMEISSPPQVAGWQAYFQEPAYYRQWANSVTIPLRKQLTDQIASEAGIIRAGFRSRLKVIELVENCNTPDDVREVVKELSALFLPKELSEIQEDYLVQALIPGLPEYEWGNQWRLLQGNPSDNNLRMAIENKLYGFFRVLFSLPEFQLG